MTEALGSRERSKKETGARLMFIGLAVWVADALLIFFLSASVKIGGCVPWLSAIRALGLMGLLFVVVGLLMRGKAEE